MLKIALLIIVLVGVVTKSTHASEVKIESELEVNLCTGFPNGTWGHCCFEHDILYWVGGSFEDRKKADLGLKACVRQAGGPDAVMYEGVRRYGFNFWSAAFGKRDIDSVNAEEADLIQNEVQIWRSIGQPHNFDFRSTEAILSPQLTPKHRKVVQNYMKVYIQTEEYKSFYREYVEVTGRVPATHKYH